MPLDKEKKSPQYVDPKEMLARFRAGATYCGSVYLREQMIDFRILTRDEEMEIRRKSMAHAAKHGNDSTERNDFIQKHTISLATNINGQPQLPISIFKELTSDELDYLYNEYVKIRDDSNPSLEVMSPEQFNAICDALKKKALGSKDLSLPQLRAICSAYADLIRSQDAQT